MDALAAAMLVTALASSTAMPTVDCGLVRTRDIGVDFGTAEAAVRTLATARLDDSRRHDREWVGGVLRTADGRYRITEGVGCAGQDTVTFSVPVTPRTELVAFWHTHGDAGQARHLFSPDDGRVVSDTGKYFYLMTPDGTLKVLRPAHARVRATHYFGALVAAPESDVATPDIHA